MLHRRYQNAVLQELESIESIESKIEYLFEKKRYFSEWNKGKEADEVKEWFKDLIEQYRTMLTFNKPQRLGRKLTTCSYTWLGNTEQLDLLYFGLKGKYIPDKTTKQNFQDVFQAKPLDTINKILWLKSNRLCAYFINMLKSKQLILEDNFWAIAEKCFGNVSALCNTYRGIDDSGKNPLGHEDIDKLFKKLKESSNSSTN
jgi:hypothetical protein